MSWTAFRWTWQLGTPLFVGASPAGALNRCRLYVPARVLWGALTAELARVEQSGSTVDPEFYREMGNNLATRYRFTYLYPAELIDGKWRAWLPRYQHRTGYGFVWWREDESEHCLPDRDFRRRMLYTRSATVIDPGSDTAAEASLRETECLQPRWRGKGRFEAALVALVGYVFVRRSSDDSGDGIDSVAAVRTLFVGGDTRYGLGRLDLTLCEELDSAARLFHAEVVLDREDPIVRSDIALAHTAPTDQMYGALEALGGWNFGQLTPLLADGMPLWTPGSMASRTVEFRIDRVGIWHLVGPTDPPL